MTVRPRHRSEVNRAAHVTFFLVCLADAKGQVAGIFDWVVHEYG